MAQVFYSFPPGMIVDGNVLSTRTVLGPLPFVVDEVTAGGTDTDAADFLTLFGLPSAAAGDALYPLLQSIMGGTLTQANFVEFDQGL